MAAAGASLNSQARIFAMLGQTDAANIVQAIEAAADDNAKWGLIETFCGTSAVPTATFAEIGDDVEDMPPFRGQPNNVERFVYNGRTQGISRRGVKQAQSLTFTISSFDRTNLFHAALEDADGTTQQLSIVKVTVSDGKSIGTTSAATARCVYGALNSARLLNGPAENEEPLEVVLGVDKVAVPVDQSE